MLDLTFVCIRGQACVVVIDKFEFKALAQVRGDIKIHGLQTPSSAASCSQLIEEKLDISVKSCSILAAASS